MLEITTIPCLENNYAFLAHCTETQITALIDAPEAAPIQAELDAQGKSLDMILITHHHSDHVGAVENLRSTAKVYGAKADEHRLPKLDYSLKEGDRFKIGAHEIDVIEAYGHTIGHIVFYAKEAKAAFTADTLMALGCGRLFEGSAELAWEGLSKIAALPPDTILYSGHEYTTDNGKFALSVDSANEALQKRVEYVAEMRAHNKPTIPSTLSEERKTNPFLRVMDADFKSAHGMADASDSDMFAHIRLKKDKF